MGKYEPLTRYLRNLDRDSWDARFAEVEGVLGTSLPNSAYEYPAWWANQESGHSQTRGWQEAGWETSKVDLAERRLRFVRRNGRRPKSDGPGSTPPPDARPDLEALFQKAATLTGEQDRAVLMANALKLLIGHESAQYLASLGGSDPEAKAPPRRRFSWRS